MCVDIVTASLKPTLLLQRRMGGRKKKKKKRSFLLEKVKKAKRIS